MLKTSDIGDALYNNVVNDVNCVDLLCNKRINNAGQERSASQLGNGLIGARGVALEHETRLGPYATHASVQPYHTGHNTHEIKQELLRRPQDEVQDIMS